VAAPTEAAASGVLGMVVVIAFFGKRSLKALKDSVTGTLKITVMIFIIIVVPHLALWLPGMVR